MTGVPSLDSALAPLPDLVSRLEALATRGPADASKAARDGKAWIGTFGWTLSVTAGAIGTDHLQTWERVRRTFRPAFAHFSLLRGGLEGAVTVRWLCDPTAEQQERIARGLGAQLEDYRQRMKFEADAGYTPTGDGKPARERIEEIEKAAHKRAVKPRQMLETTDLFKRYAVTAGTGQGQLIYRLLSAFAHGKQWAVLPSSDSDLLLSGGPSPGAEHLARVTANEDTAAILTELTMRTLAVAIRELELYSGHAKLDA